MAYLKLLWPLALAAIAFGTGFKVNDWRRDSQELAIEKAAERAAAAATTAAVDAIQDIRVQRVTIRQELEREIHHAPAVGVECDITDGVRDTLNRALAPPGSDPAGLPGPDPAR